MTSLTVIPPSGSPPTKRIAPNKWKMLDDLAFDADTLCDRYDGLIEQKQALLKLVNRINQGDYDMPDDPGIINDPALDQDDLDTVQKCRDAIAMLDPDDNYDSEGNLKKQVIAKRLTAMIGAVPTVKPAEPEIFAKMLLEHVAVLDELNYLIIESACREIERTKKFLSITEILEIIEAQQELWNKRQAAIGGIEARAKDFADFVGRIKPKIDAAHAAWVRTRLMSDLQDLRERRDNTIKAIIRRQEELAENMRDNEMAFRVLANQEAQIVAAEIKLAIATAKKEKAKIN